MMEERKRLFGKVLCPFRVLSLLALITVLSGDFMIQGGWLHGGKKKCGKKCGKECKEKRTEALAPEKLAELSRQSLQRGDLNSAIVFFNLRIALESDSMQIIRMQDTLMDLYLLTQNYTAALEVAQNVLQVVPQDTHALAIAGISSLQLGRVDRALQFYRKMADVKNSPEPLWEFASFLWQMNAYQPLLRVCEEMLARPDAQTYRIELQISETTTQKVPLAAAVYNLMGGIYHRMNQYEQARAYYQKALEISPEFLLPVSNLQELERKSGKPEHSSENPGG